MVKSVCMYVIFIYRENTEENKIYNDFLFGFPQQKLNIHIIKLI